MRIIPALLCAAMVVDAAQGPGVAQADVSSAWTAEKCRRYVRAWEHATSGGVRARLTPAFVAAHDRFVADGCRRRGRVCPVSPEERRLADTLSLMAVAEGMAGSFLPFSCTADPTP